MATTRTPGPRAKGEVRGMLIERARHRALITYAELSAKVTGVPLPRGGWSSNMGWLLGQIVHEEAQAGRPLPPAVAIRREQGFSAVGDGTVSKGLWVREVTRVHNHYDDAQG